MRGTMEGVRPGGVHVPPPGAGCSLAPGTPAGAVIALMSWERPSRGGQSFTDCRAEEVEFAAAAAVIPAS